MRTVFIITNLLAFSLQSGGATTNAPFSIQQREGIWWLTKPNGERFFSLGVCVVNQGASPARFCSTNPGYAAFQHYENSNRWAEATLKRLKSWKFTTVGGWSDFAALQQCRDAAPAFIPVLAVGMTCGVPWWDMWDTNIIARMHRIARDQILPLRNDPRLLGYYSDNEMGWWNATLFKMTLEQAPASGQRQRLLQLLRQIYHDNWPELLSDFEADGAGSFDELDRRGMLYLRPGSKGIRTYRRFLALMAERYYSLVREIIRSYDSRGLVLGDRYQSFYYPEVARASARFVDASSSNLNAAWNDGTFPRFYLDTLHALSGKPLIASEFYMAARQNRSGNKNATSTFPTVTTQDERAAGFRNTAQALARTPFVVGADWFQYYDEPTHGRFDGEDYNFGLVDIHDQPYAPLTTTAQALDLAAIKRAQGSARPDASLGLPPAPRDPLGSFTIGLALKDWDRERGFVKPVSEFPVADLYVCWDTQAVYLGLYAQDIVEECYYRNKIVPEADRAEWIVAIGEAKKPVQIRLGPGGPPACNQPAARIVNLSGVYMKTRNIAALELPAKLFGKSRFREGDAIRLRSAFFTHCRAESVEWKGEFRLSHDALASAAPSAPVTAANAATAHSVIRIKAGADKCFTDSLGNVWLSDRGFVGGDVVVRAADVQIENTQDPGLYRTEHWGMDSFSQQLPNGKYVVKLHFAETCPHIAGPGGRLFSFKVESHEFRDFDVWAKAGGPRRAYIERVNVDVTDGRLDISFEPIADSSEINGIEISPAL